MIVDAVRDARIVPVVSGPVESEYRSLLLKRKVVRLLARKGVPHDDFAAAMEAFCAAAERVTPSGEPPPCRDEKEIEGIPILTPAEVVPRLA